ncbi:MAG: hypothetical protein Q9195_003361 [Heterodermia aff. obscurata]
MSSKTLASSRFQALSLKLVRYPLAQSTESYALRSDSQRDDVTGRIFYGRDTSDRAMYATARLRTQTPELPSPYSREASHDRSSSRSLFAIGVDVHENQRVTSIQTQYFFAPNVKEEPDSHRSVTRKKPDWDKVQESSENGTYDLLKENDDDDDCGTVPVGGTTSFHSPGEEAHESRREPEPMSHAMMFTMICCTPIRGQECYQYQSSERQWMTGFDRLEASDDLYADQDPPCLRTTGIAQWMTELSTTKQNLATLLRATPTDYTQEAMSGSENKDTKKPTRLDSVRCLFRLTLD